MNERLHQILDGELPRSAASAAELAEVEQAEAMLANVLRSIPARQLPDLAPDVLRRIDLAHAAHAAPAGSARFRAFLHWLWTPRPLALQWRPAYAFALALLLLPLWMKEPVGTVTQPRQVLVQFRLDAPQASGVALAGNFTDWKPKYELTRTGGGVWTVTVPLQEGVHKYAFVVDGSTWQPDPLAPAVSDGFGGQNSQIAVLSPDWAAGS